MGKGIAFLPLCLALCLADVRAQEIARNLPDAPQMRLAVQSPGPMPNPPASPPSANTAATPSAAVAGGEAMTRQQAEQLALKNNPRISAAALTALAQKQVVRETRSAELPSLNGDLTGVDAEEASRISTGALTASALLYHVGAGVTLSQLITDFGRTRNLVASSNLQAKAADRIESKTGQPGRLEILRSKNPNGRFEVLIVGDLKGHKISLKCDSQRGPDRKSVV